MANASVAPHGFRVFTQHEYNYGPDKDEYHEVDPQDFLVTSTVHKSMLQLKELGFFLGDESGVQFSRMNVNEARRYMYGVRLDNPKRPILRVNANRDGLISSTQLPALDKLPSDKLNAAVKKRFAGYEFTPESGWAFMYFLDLATLWSRSWSDSEIRYLDEHYRNGLSLTTIVSLLKSDVPAKSMTDFIGLPKHWLERAFQS